MKAAEQLRFNQLLKEGHWYVKDGKLSEGRKFNLIGEVNCSPREITIFVHGHGTLKIPTERCFAKEQLYTGNQFYEIHDRYAGLLLKLHRCTERLFTQLSDIRELPSTITDIRAFAQTKRRRAGT